MKRMLVALAVVLSGVVLLVGLFPSQAAVPAATVQYLKNQPRDAWVMMALAVGNADGLDASAITVTGLSAPTDIERAILGVTAAKGNPYAISGVNLVSQLDGTRQQNQIGDINLVNDDIFGILAYLAAGLGGTDSRIAESRSFVISKQNSDGGFPFAARQPSDTNITAMAVNALVRSGLGASDSANQKALGYLRTAQNTDGGFGYAPNTESDTASTSWVINALRAAGIDPSTWTKNSNTPYSFLSFAALPDGSYRWKMSESQGSVIMTVYAAIALSDRSYPVSVYTLPAPKQVVASPTYGEQPSAPVSTPTQAPAPIRAVPAPTPVVVTQTAPLVRYRIEGKERQYCQGEIRAATPLELIKQAGKECGITYVIRDTSLGAYVAQINDDAASGQMGWLYLVNWKQSQSGASDHKLNNGDYVTWYYGESTWTPLWLEFTYVPGQGWISNPRHEVHVRGYKDGKWYDVANATVWAGSFSVSTDQSGAATIPSQIETRWVFATKAGHVRSHGYEVKGQENTAFDAAFRSKGNTIMQDLRKGSYIIHAPQMTPFGVDFGETEPGQAVSREFVLENTGDIPVTLSNVLLVAMPNRTSLTVNGQSDYRVTVQPGQKQSLEVSVKVEDVVNGLDTGRLVFMVTQ